MFRKINLQLVVALGCLAFASCKKDANENAQENPAIVSNFNYETSTSTRVILDAPDYLSNATFEVYTSDPDEGGKLVGRAKLDAQGSFDGNYILPTSLQSIYLKSTHVGLPSVEVEVANGRANYDFSISNGRSSSRSSFNPSPVTIGSVVYNYMGSHNSNGVPNYLTTPDVIDASFIADCNAALPEGQPVPTNNPSYLAAGNSTSLLLTDSSDVWVTFMHEGAGYKNVLAYYTYDQSNPPATAADIDSVHVIFPNASASGSGGGLMPGDKVYLGSFPSNSAIGWVLVQNAFNSSSKKVEFTNTKFYSNNDFNPESNNADQQHLVQLVDYTRGIVVIGFEDLNRENKNLNPKGYKTDDDYNDLVFYATATPFSAVDNSNNPPFIGGGNDDDGDGVPNAQDDYPTDPDKAFNNYTPFEGGFTSVVFEDLWPSKGDFDFNDLVINSNYNHITNADNEVVEMDYTIYVRHIGASFHNGYGIQWPFSSNQVASITGTNLTDGIITLLGNGTEAGQSKAVLVAFDDAFDNNGDTLKINVKLSSTYDFSTLNQEGLNPFLFVNGERGKEIHLMDHAPTDLVDMSYFGLHKDASIPAQGIYYKTANNEPWVISVSHDYDPPVEKVDIHNAYLRFGDWVNSNGAQYSNWYENIPGYRNDANIQY